MTISTRFQSLVWSLILDLTFCLACRTYWPSGGLVSRVEALLDRLVSKGGTGKTYLNLI